MPSLHDGGCSILLQDGRILVSGGSDASGPTPKVDMFNTDGTWSSAPPMLSPRAHQVCALLQSGQVLVAGGMTTGGGVTNSAEMFDPATNTWSQLPPMGEARAAATASLLQDGRVLVAGGQTSTGASNTIEIFDPNAGTFSFMGTMSASRQDAAAAVLQDGRVLIVGGSGVDANGNSIILGSSDIYDPSAGTNSVGPTLTTARKSHTATTQLDGKVVVIGGSNGSNDLASMEVFDPSVGGNFAPLSVSLATARSGHLAFLLPKNNEVLVVGGQSDVSGQETDTASAELYVPWGNQGTGAVQTTGAMSVARSQASGAPLSVVDGLLMVAGGSSQTSAELYRFALVKTDQSDYAPGTIVTITGSGWQPGETVTLTLLESPLIDTHPTLYAVADQNGNIFNNQFSPDSHDVNVRFYLSATGSQSQAQNTFTDSKPNTVTVTGLSPANSTISPGGTATYTVTVNFNGNGNSCTSPLSVTGGLPSGATPSFSPASVTSTGGNASSTLTVTSTGSTPAGSYTFTVMAANGGGTCQSGTAQNTGTLIVSAPPVITSANSTTFNVDTAGSFTVMTTGVPASTLTETGTLPTGVTFTDNGNGTATLGGTPALGTVNTYPFTIKATNSAGTTTQAFTLTVAKLNSSLTNLSSPTTTVGTGSVTLSGKVSAYPNAGGTITATVNGATSAPASLTGSANNFSIPFNTQTLGAGIYQVTYTYSGDANANGTTDNNTILTVNNAVPTATSISPNSALVGASSFTLTVNGTNFVSTSVVQFNGSPLPTAFLAANQLSATVPASALTTAGQFAVNVVNPAPGGGTSNAQTFSVNKRSTLTAVACSPGTINVNQSTTCTAAVSDTDTGTASALTGTVSFTATAGSFTPSSCTLSSGKCSVGYNAASTGGTPTITGSYGGDTTHATSSGSTNVTVNAQQATTLTVSSAGGTYGGTTNLSATLTVTSGGAAVSGVSISFTLNGTSVGSANTNSSGVASLANVSLSGIAAGTYNTGVGASFMGNSSYTASSGSATLSVGQATQTITFAAIPNHTYGDVPFSVSPTASSGLMVSLSAAGNCTLSGSTSPATVTMTAAGSCSITASQIGDTNYTAAAPVGRIFSIDKAAAVITVTPYSVTYDATAHTATGTATGVNGQALSGLDLSSTTHTNAGSYSDTWTFTDTTGNYNSTSGTVNDVIGKATAQIAVTPYTVTYDGTPHTATGTATGIGGVNLSASLNLNATVHTNAGSYTDRWTFAGGTNYNDTGSTVNDVINKADATILVTPYDIEYDGNAHSAMGTAVGIGGGIDLSTGLNLTATAHTNAGTYTDSWTFSDVTGNYNNASGTVMDVIKQAKPTLTWANPADITYGTALSGTQLNSTATGIGGTALSGTFAYNPSAGTVLTVGQQQPLVVLFTPSDPNYASNNATASINVNQAPPRIIWSNPADITYGTALGNTQLDAVAPALPLGATGWWTADENTGTTAHNVVGSDTATLQNGASWATGKYNSAFSLSAAQQQYVDAGNTPDLQVSRGDFTVAAWVYFNNLSMNGWGDMSIMDKMGTAGSVNDDGWRLFKQADDHFWFCIGQQAGVNTCQPGAMAHSTTIATSGEWYFVVATKTASAVSIYVNGKLEGSGNVGPIYDNNDASLRFGSYVQEPSYLDGEIDEPMLFNHALTATEVQTLYGMQPGTFTYTPVSGTVLNAGQNQKLSTTFTPTDTADYATANASVQINVQKVNASINVTPYSVTYDGNTHSATGTATGVNGEDLKGLDVSGTTHTNVGSYTDPWTFTDSTGNYNNATGNVNDSIAKANPTISVTPYSVTYDGNAHTATGTATGVKGEALAGLDLSATSHTDAANYTDGWTFTDATGNYNNMSGSANDIITKATATIDVTPYSVTYDGNAHTATATTIGVKGEALSGLDLTKTTHTNAGEYPSDDWTFSDSTGNYNNASGAVHDSIAKANATINITPYALTYDGDAHTASGSVAGVKGEALTGLGLGQTTHTNAGDYPNDAWTFTDSTGNYNNSSGAIHDHIDKANVTINVTPYSVTYDGDPHTATATVTGVKGEALSGLDLSATMHTNAGAYASDSWAFTDTTGNYNNASGTIGDAIAKANATVAVTPYSLTYDGNTHTATGTVNGVKGQALSGLDLSSTSHTNAGDYTNDTWTFTDSTGNYNNASGTTQDQIAKANPAINVTGYNTTYDANAHTATGSAKGVKGEPLSGLDLSGTTHTNAGTFTDNWSFADSTGNYNNANGSTIDSIAKANAAITVTPYSVIYDGNAHTATSIATGVKGEALVGLDVSGTTHTNAGTYRDLWTFTDATGNYNNTSDSVSDSISKAAAKITVTGYSVMYDGNSHTATGSAVGVKNEALSGLDLSPTTRTNAGDYPSDSWSFTDTTGNYNNTSGTVHDLIAKAKALITVTPYNLIFDGNSHTATGSAIGVKGENLSGLNLSGTTHTTAGNYTDTWTFLPPPNYNSDSGSVNDVIGKATPVINWSNPANIVYGTALGTTQLNATATGIGASALAGTFTYSPASGTVLPPGSQSLTANFVPSDTTDYVSPIARTVAIRVLFATGATCTNGMASHVIQPPIATNGTTVVKKGSTVPTKFALCDVNGNSVGPNAAFPNQNVVASYNIVSILNGTLTNVDETLSSTTPDTAFRWDPTNQQWIYNTATGSGTNLNAAPATYGFQITLIDGTTITFQYGLK